MTRPSDQGRRSFLRVGVLGGGVLAAFGAGLALWPVRRVHVPRRALQVLDATELAILAEVASAIAPTGDPVEIAHRIDELFSTQDEASRRDLRRLLRFVESGLAGALLDGRPRPFSHLSDQGKVAALSAMRDSRLALRRGGYQALRRLALSMCWAPPGSWARLGYAGPPELVVPT